MSKKLCKYFLLGMMALLLLHPGPAQAQAIQDDQYLVGAYYYVWYPDNFGFGYLREKLRPPQAITLGEYNSADPAIAAQHIAWATQYGIDFFAVDWWPTRGELNQRISQGFLRAANIKDIKFAIFHETWEMAFRPHDGHTDFSPEQADWFREDIKTIARNFFDHPSYLKINGRPVIILYLSRTFSGAYAEAINGMRADLRAMGHDPYIIGDEVYWQVLSTTTNVLVDEPQPDRFRHFDALTAYNMLDQLLEDEHSGYPGHSSHIQDIADKYLEYYQACGDETAFVPGVLPGYNDRGPRLGYWHFGIPRRMYHDAPEGSFFQQAIDHTVMPFMDPKVNMALITSWNEWNEDTSIEPLVPSPSTSQDESGAGYFTEGFNYAGYGAAYLEIVRDKFQAVHGRLTDKKGDPVAGENICVWSGETTLECSAADSLGYYTISRLHLPAGKYEVGPARQPGRKPVTVVVENSTEINLIWTGGG